MRVSTPRKGTHCLSAGTGFVEGHMLTISAQVEVKSVCDWDVDNAEETLILLLEFLLIKDLDCDDARVLDVDIKRLVPIWAHRHAFRHQKKGQAIGQ